MHIYLAGPMTGYPNDNIEAFNEAAAKLRAEGHIVFNPAENFIADPKVDRRRCLALDLAWICLTAEGIVMLPGWGGSRGALAEHTTAIALNLPITYL